MTAAAAAAAGVERVALAALEPHWRFLKEINHFPEHGEADVLVELLQHHIPELLRDPGDDGSTAQQQQQQQQQGTMMGRQLCFMWDTPWVNVGFGRPAAAAAAAAMGTAAASDGDADA